MTIYETLKSDHTKVKKLLNQLVALEENDKDQRHELITKIRDELIPHSRAEESVFYNSIREIAPARDGVMHSYEEHMKAEGLLRMLQLRDTIDAEWTKTARSLQEALEHHIEEEEGRIFTMARQLFTEEEAEMMAEAFENLKPEVQSDGFLRTTVDLVANLMPPRFSASFRTRGLDAKLAQMNS